MCCYAFFTLYWVFLGRLRRYGVKSKEYAWLVKEDGNSKACLLLGYLDDNFFRTLKTYVCMCIY